jgi:hypothetical protein
MLRKIFAYFGYKIFSNEEFSYLRNVIEEAKTLDDFRAEQFEEDTGSVRYEMAQGRINASQERLRMNLRDCCFTGRHLDGVKIVKYLP